MLDSRPRVPLNGKTVNLEQLSAETGVGLCLGADEVVAAEGAMITQDELQAAVDAHVPVPSPPVPDLEERFESLLAQLEAKGTLTPADLAAVNEADPTQ